MYCYISYTVFPTDLSETRSGGGDFSLNQNSGLSYSDKSNAEFPVSSNVFRVTSVNSESVSFYSFVKGRSYYWGQEKKRVTTEPTFRFKRKEVG